MARTAAVGAPLRHPAFQRLWLGLSISYLGDQFTIIALLWFVLQLTGSGAAVGLVILCFDLPGVRLRRDSCIRMRLADSDFKEANAFDDFNKTFSLRKGEADEFYATVILQDHLT